MLTSPHRQQCSARLYSSNHLTHIISCCRENQQWNSPEAKKTATWAISALHLDTKFSYGIYCSYLQERQIAQVDSVVLIFPLFPVGEHIQKFLPSFLFLSVQDRYCWPGYRFFVIDMQKSWQLNSLCMRVRNEGFRPLVIYARSFASTIYSLEIRCRIWIML